MLACKVVDPQTVVWIEEPAGFILDLLVKYVTIFDKQ
jgi:hypothetical protein